MNNIIAELICKSVVRVSAFSMPIKIYNAFNSEKQREGRERENRDGRKEEGEEMNSLTGTEKQQFHSI